MSERLAVVLPWPPSQNHLWRHVRVGNSCRTLKSAEGRAFDAAAGLRVRMAMLSLVEGGRLPVPPLRVTIELYPPDRRRIDTDNRVKVVLDAAFRALGRDDEEVSELHVYRRGADRANPRCEVVIEGV